MGKSRLQNSMMTCTCLLSKNLNPNTTQLAVPGAIVIGSVSDPSAHTANDERSMHYYTGNLPLAV